MQKQGERIMSRDTKKISDIDELLQEELKNPSFANRTGGSGETYVDTGAD